MKPGVRGRAERSCARCAALLLGCAVLSLALHAAAQPSLYETERAARAARARGFAIDPQPAGKRIAFVEVAREDVLVEDELWPVWPNVFHWLTREEVIRRELLIAPGERYDAARIEETMRNLRALGIFALVRIVPVRAEEPDSVGLLVYTRDLWSLRLETAFSGEADAYKLSVQLAERNFLGRNKFLAARFHIDPHSFSFGQAYGEPRLIGGDLTLDQYLDLIFNRATGQPEGSQGLLSVSRPFRTLDQRWGWSAAASYVDYVARVPAGTDIATYREGEDGRPVFCEQPDPTCLRSVWDDQSYAASLTGSYRRGATYKQTFSLGAAFSDREVAANAETDLMAGREADFARLLLPRARRQVYPFVSYSLWLPTYAVFYNLSTFGKTENVRVGPVLGASMSLPLEAFGSSSNSVKFSSDLGYVLAGRDALAEAAIATEARLEEGSVVDQRGSALLRGATPEWLLGRVVLFASWDVRRRDSARPQVTLGGDNGLRGYESRDNLVVGGNRLRMNVEYRTLPLVFESIHLGGVLFYDAGSVYAKLASAPLKHAAGAGLRLLFPQFNQSPFRLDVGVPLGNAGDEGFSVVVSYGSAQAVPLTAADDAAAAGAL